MRGLRRDEVRLLVAEPRSVTHARVVDIGRFLQQGDLIVVNTSATRPAAVDGARAGTAVTVHFADVMDGGSWTVELRHPDRSGPILDGRAGEVIVLDGGARLEIVAARSGIEGRSRLLEARLHLDEDVDAYFARVARPISYDYVPDRWPLSMYQTVFAREPGSAEMPSAGRPFSAELVTDLVGRGIVFAPVVLHTGVSSLELGEAPMPERFEVPAVTARLVDQTRAAGSRVVAVGTTVTRALESAVGESGRVEPTVGWTNLVLGPDHPARVVDGLVTGWHAPEASHQWLLEAVAGSELVERAYAAAVAERYLWHEFGDACLFLPPLKRTTATRRSR